jgi:hypothetical protein
MKIVDFPSPATDGFFFHNNLWLLYYNSSNIPVKSFDGTISSYPSLKQFAKEQLMKTINRKDLFALLLAENGKSQTTVGLQTITNIIPGKSSVTTKNRTTKIPFVDEWKCSILLKYATKTVQININYEDAVNGRKEKHGQEADFKSQGLSYGAFVEGSRVLIHDEEKGKYYVRVYETNTVLGKKNEYKTPQGKVLTKDQVKNLKENYLPKKKEEVKSQDLDYKDAVKPVNYLFDSIVQINMNDEQYKIVD